MKKILTLAFALVALAIAAIAQDEKLNVIQLTGGIALPTGDFASTSSGAQYAAAKSGLVGDLIFQHRFKAAKTRGYAAMVRSQSFSVEPSAYAVPNFFTTVGTWGATSIYFGTAWSLKLNDKIFFEPRIMPGILFASSPEVRSVSSAGSATILPAKSTSFSFLFGSNFRFDVGKSISLFANFDYTISTANFLYNFAVTGNIVQPASVKTDQKINLFNAQVGVGYRF